MIRTIVRCDVCGEEVSTYRHGNGSVRWPLGWWELEVIEHYSEYDPAYYKAHVCSKECARVWAIRKLKIKHLNHKPRDADLVAAQDEVDAIITVLKR